MQTLSAILETMAKNYSVITTLSRPCTLIQLLTSLTFQILIQAW